MKRSVLVAAILCGLAQPSFAQPACERNIESGFSYCPPAGWANKTPLNEKFKLFMGPNTPGFTPNINVKDEESTSTLDDHVAANIRTMVADPAAAGATSIQVLNQADFSTAAGERLIRVAMRVEAGGARVRALQYFFKGRGLQYFVITCLAAESSASVYDPIFDASMRTLQVQH